MTFSRVSVANSFLRPRRFAERALVLLMIGFSCSLSTHAQDQGAGTSTVVAPQATGEGLQQQVDKLEGEVAELKRMVKELQSNSQAASGTQDPPNAQSASGAPPQSASLSADQSTLSPQDKKSLAFLRDTTINVGLDGYYEYNFNAPIGRVNVLRAYDVLSNSFSLNQADLVIDHPPDEIGRAHV